MHVLILAILVAMGSLQVLTHSGMCEMKILNIGGIHIACDVIMHKQVTFTRISE